MTENEEKIIETTEENSVGAIRIASDVVATIASMAASEIPGVAGMSGGITSGLAQMLGRKQMTKGVKVTSTKTTPLWISTSSSSTAWPLAMWPSRCRKASKPPWRA